MRLIIFSLILPLLLGCHSALKREGVCLATLIPEEMSALQREDALRDVWREAHNAGYAERLRHPRAKPWLAPVPSGDDPAVPATLILAHEANTQQLALEQREQDAYRHWQKTRTQHAPLHQWYVRVSKRVDTRIEERRILSDIVTGLFPSSALLFYPLISWNLRSVLWDGADPDSEGDPVTQFCRNRLASIPELSAGVPP
jgi:hypothetical protein